MEKNDEINNDNYKKNPLLVKSIKDGKELYKKHKKLFLIGIGLSTIALIHATVGPIIIPAIMRGNIMIMSKLDPANKTALIAINKFLAKTINATEVTKSIQLASGEFEEIKLWYLANGTMLNPTSAASSLLKGIAMSSIGSAIIASPVVIVLIKSIRKLIEKMKSYDKKHGIDEINNKDEVTNNKKTQDIQELFDKYIINTEDSFEDYCKKNDLNEKEKDELREKLLEYELIDKDKIRR